MPPPPPTTLLADPSTRLGQSLLALSAAARVGASSKLRVVAKSLSALHVHALAAKRGAAFVFVSRPEEDMPRGFGKGFRTAICVVSVGQESSNNMRACQGRAGNGNVVFTVAHNVDECSEFVLAFLEKTADDGRLASAREMIANAARIGPGQAARNIFAQGFLPCIQPSEAQVLAEACGSLGELAAMSSSAGEVASRTPLSNRDALTVATIMGAELPPPPTSRRHHAGAAASSLARFL